MQYISLICFNPYIYIYVCIYQVRKVVVTGVPADRGATGRAILRAWSSSLSRGDLRGFLWQSMADGHSSAFLTKHENKLEQWIESAVQANTAEAIYGLVRQTHTEDTASPWHTVSLARLAQQQGLTPERALFLVGDQDRLATPEECEILARIGEWRFQVIEGAAHSIPIEQPELWRKAVTSHLKLQI